MWGPEILYTSCGLLVLADQVSESGPPPDAFPASGEIFWGSALANIHPGRDETWVNYDNERRAPLLFISGSADHLMPPSIQRSNAKHWNDNVITEVKEFEGPHLLPAWPVGFQKSA